jgi:hypothetical protein
MITASFIDGPWAGQCRQVQMDLEEIRLMSFEAPRPPTSLSPSEFIRQVHHVYLRETLRLVARGDTHLFYRYGGIVS